MHTNEQLKALYQIGPALGYEDHQDVLGWAESTKLGQYMDRLTDKQIERIGVMFHKHFEVK